MRKTRSAHKALCVAVWFLLGCSHAGAEDEERSVTSRFQFSTEVTEAVLWLRAEGGMGDLAPWYRLFGDGRLVRDIVFMGNHEPVRSEELILPYDAMVSLLELIVAGDVPEMTSEGLRAKNSGRALPGLKDGRVQVLELNLLKYETKGGTEISPFATQVRMLTPFYVVQKLPELREAHALVALEEALDGYFAATAAEVIRTEFQDKSFTWEEDDE